MTLRLLSENNDGSDLYNVTLVDDGRGVDRVEYVHGRRVTAIERPKGTGVAAWKLYLINQHPVLQSYLGQRSMEPARPGSPADMKAWDAEVSKAFQETNWKLSAGTPFDAKVAKALEEHTTNLDYTDWDLVERDIERAIVTSSRESLRASRGQLDPPPSDVIEGPETAPESPQMGRVVVLPYLLFVIGVVVVLLGVLRQTPELIVLLLVQCLPQLTEGSAAGTEHNV